MAKAKYFYSCIPPAKAGGRVDTPLLSIKTEEKLLVGKAELQILIKI